MIERTLVVIKPDGVARGIVGEIIKRFENVGLKIIGMKMVWIDKEFGKRHYREDIAQRYGENARIAIIDYISKGPVIAFVLEGVEAVKLVRKLVGTTVPHDSPPGTIRGDFCHVSRLHIEKHCKTLMNVIHASGSKEEADEEIKLWFASKEIHAYKTIYEEHTM